MAYYDALIAKWATKSGTTEQKLAAVNADTVPGPPTPLIVPTYKIYNAIVPSEFAALTAANQQLVRDILAMGSVDASAGTNVRNVLLSKFPSLTGTYANLVALAATYDTTIPWWQSAGYTSSINKNDLDAAGGLT